MSEDEVDVDEGVAEDEVDHGDDHEDCCSKSGKILFFILFLFCQVGDKVVVDNFQQRNIFELEKNYFTICQAVVKINQNEEDGDETLETNDMFGEKLWISFSNMMTLKISLKIFKQVNFYLENNETSDD